MILELPSFCQYYHLEVENILSFELITVNRIFLIYQVAVFDFDKCVF